jgi:peptidoglycan/xylan/chitin deacetylase (PgdA/CDA1 family)
MSAVLARPPRLLHALFPGCEWEGPTVENSGKPVLYLTFDDGPIPEETPWVLAQLALYNAAATFFCVGQNLERYPEVARAALAAGHRLGNHTHHHRSAWAASRADYQVEIAACQQVLEEVGAFKIEAATGRATPPKCLFRPPYGRLTWPLLRVLKPNFRVIMWSVLTRDYDPDLSPEKCLQLTLAAARPGDILVFHDSRKASARLRFVLPRVLAHFAEKGFRFEAL